MRLFPTGVPGIGKTTLIRSVLERLEERHCAGFYTEERRRGGQRIGFKIVTLDEQEGTFASIGRKEPALGRYTSMSRNSKGLLSLSSTRKTPGLIST